LRTAAAEDGILLEGKTASDKKSTRGKKKMENIS